MADKKFVRIPGFQADSLALATLEELVALLKLHTIEEIQISAGHQILIPAKEQPKLAAISEALQSLSPQKPTAESSTAPTFTAIRTCPDTANCKYGIRDIGPLADRLDTFPLPGTLPAKVKVSIAGCKMCCTAPFIRDIGLIAEQKGWKLIFGGNGGSRPRIGDVIAEGLSDSQAIELILRCLTVYIANAKPGMRTARFMEFFGAQQFKNSVLGQRPA